MRLWLVVLCGGEGGLRLFSSESAAEQCAHDDKMDGTLLGKPPVSWEYYDVEPTSHVVDAEPEEVWTVIGGDGGCVNCWVGAFVDEADAIACAKKQEKRDKVGLSYSPHKMKVEATYEREPEAAAGSE